MPKFNGGLSWGMDESLHSIVLRWCDYLCMSPGLGVLQHNVRSTTLGLDEHLTYMARLIANKCSKTSADSWSTNIHWPYEHTHTLKVHTNTNIQTLTTQTYNDTAHTNIVWSHKHTLSVHAETYIHWHCAHKHTFLIHTNIRTYIH